MQSRLTPPPMAAAARDELLNRRLPRYTSYPTAPHFAPDVTGETYGAWLDTLAPDQALSLYLHIPFCRQLCLYCGCHMRVVRQDQPVEEYLEDLLAEASLVARRLGTRRKVTHLHLGGGTPSILGNMGLTWLIRRLSDMFDLEGERAIELDPRHMTPSLAETLASNGFNRVSLGIQDMDERVQKAINRLQPESQIDLAVRWLRGAGIEDISVDLLYGLPYQTVESVKASALAVAAYRPRRIALFGYAHVPWMKKHQNLLPTQALPDGEARLAQAAVAAGVFEAAGYLPVGLDHFALPGDGLVEAPVARNFQGYTTDASPVLIGLGASSIGQLPQGFVQNSPDIPTWRRAVREERFPVIKGRILTDEDRRRGAVIERLMCDLSVDLAVIWDGWMHWDEALAEVDRLVDLGLCKRVGSWIEVPESARAYIRHVAAAFDAYLEPMAQRHAVAV
ncbi:oxygen-independent coproporphyrinogen III oxidase [Lacibacterium aquatile]|uniref:Coproporphyrinogen-III oxidase n=1 Tax=Lacibacterium aquatile TaxID=1168082 RepID=A0ABW5E0M5_9PROT